MKNSAKKLPARPMSSNYVSNNRQMFAADTLSSLYVRENLPKVNYITKAL